MRTLLFFVAASAFAAVPTPESVLGHKPGDDFYLATYEDSLGYFRKLAASSDRIKLEQVGKTTQGRDWYIAFISNPENLAQLDHFKDVSRRLAVARGIDDAAARRLAGEMRPIIHIDGGLHANEVANHQHTIQLGYDLVASEEPVYKNIRANLIVELWFSINPDGQDAVVNWYRQNVGTEYEISPLPYLYQEYVGHDNNRDGYMLNMIESRVVTKATLDTEPLIFYTHHQSAPFPGRIYMPPFPDPISGNMHPLMIRWLNLIGTTIAQYLDQEGLPGSMHGEHEYDAYYAGYLDNIGNFRHTISFYTETALYAYATPHFYTVNDFPQQRQALDNEMLYSSPWKGGWWRLADACKYMHEASIATLDLASRYHEQMQYNKYRAARDTIEHFEKEPPFAYVIPREQHDAPTAATLIEKLMLNGIEVHQSAKPDAWVILMNQPFAGLVKEIFEVQKPILTERPPDVTGWTLPFQMDVEVNAVTTPLTPEFIKGLEKVTSIQGLAAPFNRNANASFRAVNRILAEKGSVSFAGEEITVSGLEKSKLDAILAENHLKQTAAKEGGKPVKPARAGLYRSWQANIDEGWTRWILEQFDFPFTSLYNADVRAGHLRDRFDVIIIPDSNARSILEGHRPGTIPERYAGGIGPEGADALREFVSNGGTLVTFNNASLFAIDQFNLPVTNALDRVRPNQFFCNGCLLKIHVEDAANPLTGGLSPDPIVMFERSPAFDTKPDFKGTVLARYARERSPIESGFIIGPERLEGKAAAIDADYGKGHVILLGFRPQWRGQSQGTYKFFFNALYLR